MKRPHAHPQRRPPKADNASAHRTSLLKLYGIVCVYRIVNALFIHTQFDADEYWQCLEPAYCLAFSSTADTDHTDNSTQYGCAYTWEWTRRFEDPGNTIYQNDHVNIKAWLERALHGPVRSFVPVMPTYVLYVVARWLGLDTPWVIARGPLVVNAVLVAAPTDVATVYISRWIVRRKDTIHTRTYSVNVFGCMIVLLKMTEIEWWALLASITSWFNGYALVRTYSNSMEAMLLSVGIALLCPNLFSAESKRCSRSCSVRPSSALAFVLGGLSVCVRFTAIAAWIPIGIVCSVRRRTIQERLMTFFGLCACFGFLGILLGVVLDRFFYGFWAVPFLGSFHFNVMQGNGSLYGTHHPLWYLFAGLPAICGILLPLFVASISKACTESKFSARRVVAIIVLFYVAPHSFSAHKEFRFMLPILHLICVLSASCITECYVPFVDKVAPGITAPRRRVLFFYLPLFLLNYPHLLFLGSTHQAASIGINREIVKHIQAMETGISSNGQRSSKPREHSIHYLMGCHSTPVYSHLHIRGARIRARALDCSPQCRADPNTLCEAELFQVDPFDFINSTYASRNLVPEFIAIFDESVRDERVQRALLAMGLTKVANISHEINELRLAEGRPSVTYREMFLYMGKYVPGS